MSVSDDVGILLGRSPLSDSDRSRSVLFERWAMDKIDARAIAQAKTVDPAALNRIVTLAVAAAMRGPADGAIQATTTVDDATVTRTYDKAPAVLGDIDILPEWWAELGLSIDGASGTFSVRPIFEPDTPASQWV